MSKSGPRCTGITTPSVMLLGAWHLTPHVALNSKKTRALATCSDVLRARRMLRADVPPRSGPVREGCAIALALCVRAALRPEGCVIRKHRVLKHRGNFSTILPYIEDYVNTHKDMCKEQK